MQTRYGPLLIVLLFIALVGAGCAPGDERFAESLPGFFWGLWHGAISFFTLIASLFSDNVTIYQGENTGFGYNIGYLFGVACAWGGGGRGGEHTWRRRGRGRVEEKKNREEWEEVGRKVEEKVKRKLRDWADAEPDESWDDVERKVEEKTRAVIRDWADKP